LVTTREVPSGILSVPRELTHSEVAQLRDAWQEAWTRDPPRLVILPPGASFRQRLPDGTLESPGIVAAPTAREQIPFAALVLILTLSIGLILGYQWAFAFAVGMAWRDVYGALARWME
jgi:hypothetical protein